MYEVVVKDEPTELSEVEIIKVVGDFETVIDEFGAPALKKIGERDYQQVRAKFGPLAASDPERHSKSQRDARFEMNPLLREPLAIEQEERHFIDEQVRAEVEALRARAQEEGYQAGHAEGLGIGEQKAFEETRRIAQATQQRFDQLVEALENSKAALFRVNEQFLVEIALKVARHVVLRELATDRDYVVRLVRELVDRIGVRDNLTVRVSQADFEVASDIRTGLEAHLGALKNLRIEPSSKVVDGGCLVETDWSVLDAAVETQLAVFRDSLVHSIQSASGSGEGSPGAPAAPSEGDPS
jgi:flagellar assembly protein FliH